MDGMARPTLSPDAIVSAAEQLIHETGSTEWTVRSLSRVLECAPGALYRHFPGGTAEIAAEIRARDFGRLEARLDAAEESPEAPGLACLDRRSCAARLVRRCRAYLEFARSHGAVYQHLFGAPASDGAATAYVGRAMIERPAALIQDAARARELNRPAIGHTEASQAATFIWVQLHGFADLRLSGIGNETLEDLEIRLLVNLLNLAGFSVAATPAGLEAAARQATRPGRSRPASAALTQPSGAPIPGFTPRPRAAAGRG